MRDDSVPDPPVQRDEPRARIAELEAQVDSLETTLADTEDLIRQYEVRVADATNEIGRARERIEKESHRERELDKNALLAGFLEVLDNLDRAVEAGRRCDDQPTLLAGVELARRSFLSMLEQHDVRHAPSLGASFDPYWHQAVSRVAVDDPVLDGTIVGVVREGYQIGDEPLRVALVAVGTFGPTGR